MTQKRNNQHVQNEEYKAKIKQLESDINVSKTRLHAELEYHQHSVPILSQLTSSVKQADEESHTLHDRIALQAKTIKTLKADNYRMKKENERFQGMLTHKTATLPSVKQLSLHSRFGAN